MKLPIGKISKTLPGGEESIRGLINQLTTSRFTGYIEAKLISETGPTVAQLVLKEGGGVLAEYSLAGKPTQGKDGLKNIVRTCMNPTSQIEVHEAIDADMMMTFFRSATIKPADFDIKKITQELEVEEKKRHEEEERRKKEESRKQELRKLMEGWQGEGYNVSRLQDVFSKPLNEIEDAVNKFRSDVQTLRGLESKLEGLLPKAKGFEDFVTIIEQNLNNPDAIPDLLSQIDAIEKGIAELEERKEQLRKKVAAWKKEGYVVERLERTIDQDLEAAWNLFTVFTDNIQRLKEMDQKLQGLESKGFDDETMEIETHLNNPDEVERLDGLISNLERAISYEKAEKANLSKKIEEYKKRGYVVAAVTPAFQKRLTVVAQAVAEYEQSIAQLTVLRSEIDQLNVLDFQQEAQALTKKFNDPANLGTIQAEISTLRGKIDSANRRREEIATEVSALKSEGYNVERVEESFAHSLSEIEKEHATFKKDLEALSTLATKLNGLNTRFLDADVAQIRSKLKDRTLIKEIDQNITALAKKIDEREAKRGKIRQQMDGWKKQGYVIQMLEAVIEEDLPALEEVFNSTKAVISDLASFEKELKGLDVKWFKHDADNISSIIKDTARAEETKSLLGELKAKIDTDKKKRQELKGKFQAWIKEGFEIGKKEGSIFDRPIAEVQTAVGDLEQRITLLENLSQGLQALPAEDIKWFKDDIKDLLSKMHDPDNVSDVESEFGELTGRIASEKEKRDGFRAALAQWKSESFIVTDLEKAIEDKIEKVTEIHANLAKTIGALKADKTTLEGLDAKWFQKEAQSIRQKLNNPALVQSIQKELAELDAKIKQEKEKRAGYKAKYEQWQIQGLKVDKLSKIMEEEISVVEVEFNAFEKDLKLLMELQEKLGANLLGGKSSAPASSEKKPVKGAEKPDDHVFQSMALQKRFTFPTFVVGTSNRFTHAAAQAVAESPAEAYNPLYVYGGPGLGKTHLLNAIGNHIADTRKDAKIIYVTSEKFTNDLIDAVRYDKIKEFRELYRTADLLLIDDIQFLAGKESTQEEFFHTFNTLYNARKQIVITSDKPPKDISMLEERLRSRFEGGLITDIQPPSLETKIIILRRLAKKENLDVPDDVMHLIASKVKTSIRELEGALTKMAAFSNISKRKIDMDLAKEVLKDLVAEKKEDKEGGAEGGANTEKSKELMNRLSNLKKRLKPMSEDEKKGASHKKEDLAKCGNCGQLIPSNSPKCPKCGVDFGGEWFECPKCGELVSGESNKCPQCGAEFDLPKA